MTDYSNSVIYNITCKNKTVLEKYIGSTHDKHTREGKHKEVCNNYNSENYNLKVYQFIRANGGWHNWKLEVLENYPCENEIQLIIRERYYYDKLNPELNMIKPYISEEEIKVYQANYRAEHKVEAAKYNAIYKPIYKKENKEKLALQNSIYYETNKEKFKQYALDNAESIKLKRAIRYQKNKKSIIEKGSIQRRKRKQELKEQKEKELNETKTN